MVGATCSRNHQDLLRRVNRRFLRLRVFCRLAFDLSLQGHRSPLDEIVRRVGNLLPRVRDRFRSGTIGMDTVERRGRIGRTGPVIMRLGPALSGPGAAPVLAQGRRAPRRYCGVRVLAVRGR